MIFFSIIIIIVLLLYLYWRFFYFFRDPKRIIPIGNNIVSPADGTVVYVKKVVNGKTPIIIKRNKVIKIDEITKKIKLNNGNFYHIGIFMHPTSIHINRAPITGKVSEILHLKYKNFPMTLMWMRVLFNKYPYEKNSNHVIKNERNIIKIIGDISCYVIQIADIYVSKIVCNIKQDDKVIKGQKIGAIKMGSQVDMLFPIENNIEVVVNEGDKVKAGMSIIANILDKI